MSGCEPCGAPLCRGYMVKPRKWDGSVVAGPRVCSACKLTDAEREQDARDRLPCDGCGSSLACVCREDGPDQDGGGA